jgi:5-methylcytosine-specific restriction endonuclease McrA
MKYATMLKKWSYRIRIRDKNICFFCEKKRKQMEAHHIYPKSIYRKKALKLENGITLCDDCHKLVHISSKAWRKYTPSFNSHMRRKAVKEFNNNSRYATYTKYKKRKKKKSRKKR